MSLTRIVSRPILRYAITLAAALVLLSAVSSADDRFHLSSVFLYPSKPLKPKKLDQGLADLRVPKDIDQNAPLGLSCRLNAQLSENNEFKPIKGASAVWETALYILDHSSSSFEVLDVADGTLKTNEFGSAFMNIPVPPDIAAAIFTDGFESGDVTAWFVTDFRPKKGKKLNYFELGCELSERDR